MINYTEITTEQKSFKGFLKNTVTDEDLYSKLKQIKEVTNCNEEQGILILHDCNYNVEHAINKILTSNSQIDFEWKTKKGKQKKVQIKNKGMDKDDANNNLKDIITGSSNINNEIHLPINETNTLKHIYHDSYSNGKTFRNYNLSKKEFSGYFYNDNGPQYKSIMIDLNCHWDGKSIVIEHPYFAPMSITDTSNILEIKSKPVEKPLSTKNNLISKDEIAMDSSIMFKTHCSTKPPPKVQYSLASPVQIMNKNISQRSMPKLKFGDTDFCDNSKMISSESPLKITSNNDFLSQPSVINVEDNSIIKVGPSQKAYVDQSSSNFALNSIYNQNSYFQPNFNDNTKMNEYQNCKSSDQYYDKFGYINVHNQLPVGNVTLSCNTGFQSLGSYTSTNIKEISNHSKTTEVFLNQSQPSTYPPQSNIYIVPGVMMNPLNTLYMTVANPLPTSALSPPMATIPAQYKVPQPQQHNQIYFNESHNQADTSSRIKRQYSQTRQQLSIDQSKKSYGDLSDEASTLKQVDIVKGNFKGIPNFNQNQLPKQVPINYSVFINSPPNRSQLISNQLNHFSGHYPQQQQHELNSFENRKRNMSIQNNNFSGQSWS